MLGQGSGPSEIAEVTRLTRQTILRIRADPAKAEAALVAGGTVILRKQARHPVPDMSSLTAIDAVCTPRSDLSLLAATLRDRPWIPVLMDAEARKNSLSRIIFENNEKIRPRPDRETPFAMAAGGGRELGSNPLWVFRALGLV